MDLCLQKLRGMWASEMAKDEPNLDVKYQYALTLIKTRSDDKNREGLSLLQGVCLLVRACIVLHESTSVLPSSAQKSDQTFPRTGII